MSSGGTSLLASQTKNAYIFLFSGNPLWYKTPGKLPFNPDSEFDDGFSTSDCENNHLVRFFIAMFYVVGVLLNAGLIYTDIAVIKELVRVKALKWNATTYSLFILLWTSFGLLCVDLIYLFNMWDADKTEFWYRTREMFFTYCIVVINIIVDFEVGVTWIDLYDRTNRMSKSTSKVLKGLRWGLRSVALALTLTFFFMAKSGGILNLLISALGPSVVGMIFVTIGGRLIARTLCPDKKDVANPNWKIAEAIRRAVKHAAGTHFLQMIGLVGMAVTGRHPQLGYLYGLFCALYFFSHAVRMWAWLHYLIYGMSRRLLECSFVSIQSLVLILLSIAHILLSLQRFA